MSDRGDVGHGPDAEAGKVGSTLADAEWARVRERLPHAIYLFDIQARRTRYSNGRFAEALGYTAADRPHPSGSFLSALHPEDAARLPERFGRFDRIGDDQTVETEFRLLHKDGRYRWFLSVDRVFERDENGRVKLILGTACEISASKATEQDRARMASLEAIGRLAGGVAHDFNNLLTVVLANVRLARRASRNGESAQRELDEIELVAREAAALTRQLLVVASRDPSRGDEPTASCDPVAVVREIAPILRRLIEENVEIVYELDPTTPRCAFARGNLVQILLNLAVNARDAMPNGGTLRITVGPGDIESEPSSGPWVSLRVADTGEGMTPEVVERIFDPFFSTKAPERGTGLGLATVDQLVRAGGGRVSVRSTPQGGTAFSIVLSAEEPVRSVGAAPAASSALQGLSILLCEDNELVRRATKTLLEESGCEIVAVADGDEAVREITGSNRRFDLVLSDIVMPKKSGLEVATVVQKERPETPVLLWSGYPLPVNGRLVELDPAGIRILQKPVEPAVLYEAIRDLVDTARRAS